MNCDSDDKEQPSSCSSCFERLCIEISQICEFLPQSAERCTKLSPHLIKEPHLPEPQPFKISSSSFPSIPSSSSSEPHTPKKKHRSQTFRLPHPSPSRTADRQSPGKIHKKPPFQQFQKLDCCVFAHPVDDCDVVCGPIGPYDLHRVRAD
ncbi:hypothetical protein T440DRAFT_37737 [Plenodomus tracheiphilus IPT5]|uniref:Uncharacterized protein n=1 Tax=Plenodomus tracheiphilus IPT5 TaxID=1408161 RepID=A0A6A7BA19_9PLEO|nr:hypothetical protein T440DRAFT_37737 [Plenodomus tracheiphilus IPT5]